jgi:hypothetical protein
MPAESLLSEVGQLNDVGVRLDQLAEEHPFISEELLAIAGNVRGSAALLEVLVAVKLGRLSDGC